MNAMREISDQGIAEQVKANLPPYTCDCLRAAMRGYCETGVRRAAAPQRVTAGGNRSYSNALARVNHILKQHHVPAGKAELLMSKALSIAISGAVKEQST